MRSKKGFTVWLTGLPGSGKTTIAGILKKELEKRKFKVESLDGDEVRKGLSSDLGFSEEDREKHARRVAYVSKLLSRNGIITIVALISPYRRVREFARSEIPNFVEVFVNCPLEICIQRDPKGLYKKALKGEIKDLTGLQAPYEEPLKCEIVVNTNNESPEESAAKIITKLEEHGYI